MKTVSDFPSRTHPFNPCYPVKVFLLHSNSAAERTTIVLSPLTYPKERINTPRFPSSVM